MDSLKITDENIIYISQFGSYNTEEWVENKSDIDIGIIVKSLSEIDFYFEDLLLDKLKEIYNYSNVNITTVELNLEDKLTRNIICGKTLFSLIHEQDLKYQCLAIEKEVGTQRNYYEFARLEKLKSEVNELW